MPIAVKVAKKVIEKGKSVLKGRLSRRVQPRKHRSRGMFLRRGRLYLGFAQKEIKNAMRRVYGGRRRK